MRRDATVPQDTRPGMLSFTSIGFQRCVLKQYYNRQKNTISFTTIYPYFKLFGTG